MLDTGKLEIMARAGFAARGLVYGTIGYLTLRVGRTEDNNGALSVLESGGGKLLLAVLAVGFLGYGLWRLSEALIDTDNAGSSAKGVLTRIGGGVSGIIHFALSLAALRLALGDDGGQGDDAAHQGASAALSLPGGAVALAIAAAILMGVAAYQIVKAIKLGFLKHLAASAAHRRWIAWAGRAGYLARGTVFALSGYSLWDAARSETADRAGGVEQALDALPPLLQMIVAAGFLLFGLFSLVEARYRRINDPDVIARLKAMTR